MVTTELVDLFSNIILDTLGTVPTLLGATLILVIGWALGKILRRVIYELLKKVKVDEHIKLGGKLRVSEILSLLVAWTIYLAFFGATVDFLRIASLTAFFTNIQTFLLRLIGGIAVLLVGYVVAGFVQKQVQETKAHYSEILSQVIFFFTLIITISMAFEVVGIPTDLLNGIILLLVGGISLGLAIALGLGLKESVIKLSKKYVS